MIEYVRGAQNSIAEALFRLDSVAFDSGVPSDFAKGVPSIACPALEADRLNASTDWITEQRPDATISVVIDKLKLGASPDATDIK